MEELPQSRNRTVSAPESAMRGRADQPVPTVTTLEDIEQSSGYKALEEVRRPSYWGFDRDFHRRPGYPALHKPKMMHNALWPIERQPGEPAAPMHGRPNKRMPPVFGDAVPLKGLSGLIRRAAYRLPDHKPTHWLLLMAGDRVDVMESRLGKAAPVVIPLVALGVFGRRFFNVKRERVFRFRGRRIAAFGRKGALNFGC